MNRSIASIGDIKSVARGDIADTLRLFKPGKSADHFAFGEIDNADAVVAEFRNKETLSFEIDSQVIDPPGDFSKRNFVFHRQEFFGAHATDGQEQREESDGEYRDTHDTFLKVTLLQIFAAGLTASP